MEFKPKVLCVVLARGGSKTVPRKNMRELGGQPLVGWPINAALNCEAVTKVVCSSEDDEILNYAESLGAITLKRPMHLAKDETASPPVVLHAINHFENLGEIYDYVFMLEPTSPLTEAKDLDEALNLILKNSNKFDSLVTIAESISGHPDFTFSLLEDLSINSINQIDWKVKRRQEISKLYFIEGTLYLSKISSFKKSVAFVQKKTLGMVVTREKSFEVDEELDFYLIEAVLKFRDEKLHVGN